MLLLPFLDQFCLVQAQMWLDQKHWMLKFMLDRIQILDWIHQGSASV